MQANTLSVALAGNPNTGKSTLFNALTGLRQHVGNYPGVTVELKKGTAYLGDTAFEIIDLPGTYSLAARSPDEMVAVDLLLGHRPEEKRPEVVVSVVDASNLERHLYLTTQLMDLGVPVVLAVNLIDVATKQRIVIDFALLSEQLKIPVVPIQANRGIGLDDLKRAINEAAAKKAVPVGPAFPEAFDREVEELRRALPTGTETFLLRRLILDVNGSTEQRFSNGTAPEVASRLRGSRERLNAAGGGFASLEAKTRYGWIRQAVKDCVKRPSQRVRTLSDRLDTLLTHKLWGTLIFLAVMFTVFQSIFLWALPLMNLIDSGKELLAKGVELLMAPGPMRSLLVDGVVKGVGSVLVFLPQILILFAFIAVLEDCGYMARAAFLMDKIMSRCGLNGKSFIPLLSSMACAIPGIMATRTIENKRDRFATILVAPLMSCSARLPLYILLIGVFLSKPSWLAGLVLFGMYLIGLIVAPLIALLLKRTLLKGETPLFIMEMPSFKVPLIRNVLRRMLAAGWAFVYRAGTLILASMILVWFLLYYPTANPNGGESFDRSTNKLETEIVALEEEKSKLEETKSPTDEVEKNLEAKQSELNRLLGEWKRQSYLGQAGRALEPAFEPLGWDWRIGMAALASFPAREVIVGTLGIIYNEGEVDPKAIKGSSNPADTPLGKAIKEDWDADPVRGKYRVPVALSLMVFFALCCQCASTLAVIRRETRSWLWPLFTFVYMTVLAYLGALATFQIGRLVVG